MVWRWDSTPFGDTLPNEDPDGDGQALRFNLRFPGQYFDVETGLHYNYFRDYDPATGRYVQSDPIGLRGGLNSYAYALQNPVNILDYQGLNVTGSFVDHHIPVSGLRFAELDFDFEPSADSPGYLPGLIRVKGLIGGTILLLVYCTEDESCPDSTGQREGYVVTSFTVPPTIKFDVTPPIPILLPLGLLELSYILDPYIDMLRRQYGPLDASLVCKQNPSWLKNRPHPFPHMEIPLSP